MAELALNIIATVGIVAGVWILFSVFWLTITRRWRE